MLDPGTQDLGSEEDKIHGSFHKDTASFLVISLVVE